MRVIKKKHFRPFLACGAAVILAAAAGCTSGPGQPAAKPVGPLITLRVGLYGSPGYRQAGLYAQYERLHRGIRIVQDDAAQQAGYWQTLLTRLRSGRGLDDIQAIPMADISTVTGPLSGDFEALNTLGGASSRDDGLPWVAQQSDRAGDTYALGAEIGPVAVCYRTDLMAEAGLPTSPAVLARDWSTWSGYLRLGREFKAHIPQGPAFTDSVTSLYNAMVGQATQQYYSSSGSLVVSDNPVIKSAWATAVTAAQEGLSAKLVPQSPGWDQGVTRASFATVICPASMLRQISSLAGAVGSGQWNVTTAPGRAGNSGGFYLAIPKASAHQRAAAQLAAFLTGEQAGVTLFRDQGDFPANRSAVTAVDGVTSQYFSGANVGRIFGDSADLTRAAVTGPASVTVASDLDEALAQVEIGHASPGLAWSVALNQAKAAQAASG